MELSPESFHLLTKKIIDNSKVGKKNDVATLQVLSLVGVLLKARTDDIKEKAAGNQSNHAPATTTNHSSVKPIATPQQNTSRFN